MAKTVIYLIGLKGSGKTYIGALLSRKTDIRFLRVEPIMLGLTEGEDGWAKVAAAVDEVLAEHDRVAIESLGGHEGFERLHASLAERYVVKYVRVVTDPATCLRRVQARSTADHIPVSDDQVVEYNAVAEKVELPWDAVIDNNGPATDAEILAAIAGLG
jgi:shikimate kinase